MTRVVKPALLISGAASGSGKTSIVAGLARSLVRSGKRVAVFKIGPDFLDPMILSRAAGAPVHQLDLWMMGEAECRDLLYRGAVSADYVLIEGALGLFDGAPSAADFARCFNIPVANVVNAKGTAETAHAIGFGLSRYCPDLEVTGYVINNIASERHQLMVDRVVAEPDTPYLGSIRKNSSALLPSRHLGLHCDSEIPDIEGVLERLADLVDQTNLSDAFRGRPFDSVDAEPKEQPLSGKTISVAYDDAFCFLYRRNLQFLEEAGARLCYFSPLRDKSVPACDAVYLPGGYPELHAAELAENMDMRRAIRELHRNQTPIYAECGGMLYLLDALRTTEQHSYQMCGVISGSGEMTSRLQQLGYQRFEYAETEVRGHTFHYSKMTVTSPPALTAQRAIDGNVGESAFMEGNTFVSYIHTYFPSSPSFIVDLLLGRVGVGALQNK